MIKPIPTPLMNTTADFMRKVEEAQLGLEGLATRGGADFRFYKAILAYYNALEEFDEFSLQDDVEMLPYSEADCAFLYRTVEPAFLKLVLAYQEFKDRKCLKG